MELLIITAAHDGLRHNMYEYKATVVKVIDGDTIDFMVDLGFNVNVGIRTRILGVDTPEVSSVEGRTVREILRSKLPFGTPVILQTSKNPGDKYGRWLARVQIFGIGDLSTYLIQEGFAKVYDGGIKP